MGKTLARREGADLQRFKVPRATLGLPIAFSSKLARDAARYWIEREPLEWTCALLLGTELSGRCRGLFRWWVGVQSERHARNQSIGRPST